MIEGTYAASNDALTRVFRCGLSWRGLTTTQLEPAQSK